MLVSYRAFMPCQDDRDSVSTHGQVINLQCNLYEHMPCSFIHQIGEIVGNFDL